MLRCEQGFAPSDGLGEWWKQPYLDEVKQALIELRVKNGKSADFHPSEYESYGLCKAGGGCISARDKDSEKRASPAGQGLEYLPNAAESVKKQKRQSKGDKNNSNSAA